MFLDRILKQSFKVIPVTPIYNVPKLVQNTPENKYNDRMNYPVYALTQTDIFVQQKVATDHKKDGNCHTAEAVRHKRKQISSAGNLSVPSAIYI